MNDEDLKELFATVVNCTVLPHENVNDVVAGGFALGERRANLLDRPFSPGDDVAHVLSIFCWWPFKPALTEQSIQYLQNERWGLFRSVSHSPSALQDLLGAVPSEILILNNQELFDILRQGEIRRVLMLPARMG